MAITVNTKTPTAITVSSVGSGNSPYTKERNPHRGDGGGHFAPASTGKFMSNEERLKKEIERLREENARQRQEIMLLNSMIQTEHEIIRVAALKEGG